MQDPYSDKVGENNSKSKQNLQFIYIGFWDGPEHIGQQSNRSMISGPAFTKLSDCYEHLKKKYESRTYHWYKTESQFLTLQQTIELFNKNETNCVFIYDYHWYKYWISKFELV